MENDRLKDSRKAIKDEANEVEGHGFKGVTKGAADPDEAVKSPEVEGHLSRNITKATEGEEPEVAGHSVRNITKGAIKDDEPSEGRKD